MIEIANSTRYTIAGSTTKMPSPTTDRNANAANVHKAAPIQTITKMIEKMKAMSMYVFIVDKFVLDVGGGGGGGFEYDIFFKNSLISFLW